jgi:hypothetical protein
MENKPMWDFLQRNYKSIDSLMGEREKYAAFFRQRLSELRSLVSLPPDPRIRQWIYGTYDLVHDFTFPGGNIAVDTNVFTQGKPHEWSISINARPAGTGLEERKSTVREMAKVFDATKPAVNGKIEVFVLASFSINDELAKIKEKLDHIISEVAKRLPTPAQAI